MRVLLSSVMLFPLFAQQEGARPPREAREPKNLKILQPADVRPAMQAFRVALGVQCSYCHVQGDFASDENGHKAIARKMLLMTQEINGKFPDGKRHVTCYTCHRGVTEPVTAPPAATPAAQ